MRKLRIFLCLLGLYIVSWFMLSGVALTNDRTEVLINFGEGLMVFIQKILAFPLNLIDAKYPFLIDQTGKELESSIHPLILIGMNILIQVFIVDWIWKIKTKLVNKNR